MDSELLTSKLVTGMCFVCPACKGELDHSDDAYSCGSCEKQYPVLYGIVDFRLRSDRYLTLEQERDKAKHLYEYSRKTSFEELLTHYYNITGDVPPELAQRYRAYILNAPKQAGATLAKLEADSKQGILLDLGCGAGGLLVAASGQFKQLVGVDIALRWLVICKKRLEELNIQATLVCADAEQLPFEDGRFSHVVAADLVEHVYDASTTIEQCWKQLKPGGRFWLSATNRYCLGPHPLTRIWGIGYLPRAVQRAMLIKLRGVDSLRYTYLVSPGMIKKLCTQSGFGRLEMTPRQLNIEDISGYPWQDRMLIRIYQILLRFVLFRRLLLYVGPAFEMKGEKNYS